MQGTGDYTNMSVTGEDVFAMRLQQDRGCLQGTVIAKKGGDMFRVGMFSCFRQPIYTYTPWVQRTCRRADEIELTPD